jgi:uncharacterized protein YjbK
MVKKGALDEMQRNWYCATDALWLNGEKSALGQIRSRENTPSFEMCKIM